MQNTIMGKSLEEEISQKKFRNNFHRVQLNIIYTAGWIQGRHMLIFKKYNISPQQYNVLRILRGAMPSACSVQMIRARMLDKMSDTSRLVERLRRLNYIARITNKDDRRSVQISISEKGLLLLKEMESEEMRFDEISSNLSPDEAQQLSLLLDKLRD